MSKLVFWILVWATISFVVGFGSAYISRRLIDRTRHPKPPKKRHCTGFIDGLDWQRTCAAFAWEHCSDGRCRFHCGQLCKCSPLGRVNEIRVLNGGKQ